MKNEIVLFTDGDVNIEVMVTPAQDTVWLNRAQMAELFGRDVKTIGKHIVNARREELKDQVVVAKFATTTQHGALAGKTQTHMTECKVQKRHSFSEVGQSDIKAVYYSGICC